MFTLCPVPKETVCLVTHTLDSIFALDRRAAFGAGDTFTVTNPKSVGANALAVGAGFVGAALGSVGARACLALSACLKLCQAHFTVRISGAVRIVQTLDTNPCFFVAYFSVRLTLTIRIPFARTAGIVVFVTDFSFRIISAIRIG